MAGILISLEGNEASGKSTNKAYIASKLQEHGIEVVLTREPGGTPLAEKFREILLAPIADGEEQITNETELLLMYAARSQHVSNVIIPAIKAGKAVICDRMIDSSMVYQHYARGIPRRHIEALNNLVLGELRPDITLIFDLPVEVGLTRATKRAGLDRLEQESIQFFERVRNGYLEIAKQEPNRCFVLDAEKPLVDVQAKIDELVPELIALMRYKTDSQ